MACYEQCAQNLTIVENKPSCDPLVKCLEACDKNGNDATYGKVYVS